MVMNQATMVAAVQYYFDNVLFVRGQRPKVDSISQTVEEFTVLVSERSEDDD